MKKPLIRIATFIVVFSIVSCSQISKNDNFLPPLNIEIPADLKGNPEAVSFIKDSEKAINQYTQSAEELAAKLKPYINKKEEELGAIDKVKMLGALGQFTANFTMVGLKYGEMLEKSKALEESMSEEQAAALATVLDAFKNRMQQIEEKYKDFNQVQ